MSLRLSKGFTMVELMVTISILAILMTIAFPSFRSTLRSNRVANANNEILGLVALARSEAIRNSRGGGVCASSAGSTCDGGWNGGLMAYSDEDGSGSFNSGDTVLRYVAGRPNLVLTGPSAEIAFDARGRRRASADQVLTVAPDSCAAGDPKRSLTVNLSGQVRVLQETC